MKRHVPSTPPELDASVTDLVERLERYRKRVRSEGRSRALTRLDQAIVDAANVARSRR